MWNRVSSNLGLREYVTVRFFNYINVGIDVVVKVIPKIKFGSAKYNYLIMFVILRLVFGMVHFKRPNEVS